MSDRSTFGWATTGARLIAGTLVSAGFAVAVVTSISVPWPTITREPVSLTAVPAAEDSVLACDGDLLALGRDLADVARLTTAAPQAVTVAADPDGPEVAEDRLDGPVDGPLVLTAPAQDRTAVDVAAAGSATVDEDDLRGFAASACRPALMESWLVAGSGSTGAADLLLLANPGEVAATVDMTVYGGSGPQTPPGSGLILPAGAQRVIPLAGLVLGEESPVVRVTSTGAPVQAALQASITRTLEPGGVDQVGAVAAASPQQVIAGVAVTGGDGEDASTLVRLLAPAGETTATVTVFASGATTPAAEPLNVPLNAGVPTEVELRGLSDGRYTVIAESDEPIVASVWQALGLGEGSDFAWFTPAPEVTAVSMFATPAGPAPWLTLTNTGDEPITVHVRADDGSSDLALPVGAGATTSTRLAADAGYVLDSGGAAVHAGLSFTRAGALAGYPVWSSDAAAPPITVYP
ncbi:DUF5719 family protein [Microbacterium terricola]|uniref:Large extracellular alpha-helical protein n=1 Tax=Microbacterium terricola TaxID=344163 RepID=A0ABM8DX34_9MICO|nr:DUF5719 family protein [Microbacterium terricola]UYK39224.1 DUF5719 family protein [Microbacterium terricola]BDV30056.1 hypothetical protein Microterr_07160 [Microbacterium terricola]